MKKRTIFYWIAATFLVPPILIFLLIPVQDRLRTEVAFPLAMLAILGAFLFLLVIYYATVEATD